MTPYFDDQTVRRLLSLEALLPELERALIGLSGFGDSTVLQPLRSVMEVDPPQISESQRTLLFTKPARIDDALCTKLITLAPRNSGLGLPTLMATAILMNADTGAPRAIMDATWLTNLRTAAVSAIGAKLFTPANAAVVALIGSGALARTHALALRAVRPIREIRVWSPTQANAARCAAEVEGIACATAEQAVRGADIVCTVTNATEPVVLGKWLKSGSLVVAVGAPRPGWRELDDDAMAHYLVADKRESAEQEAGDVIDSGARVQAEIGELLAGARPMPAVETTVIFKALGQAVEDAVAAQLVYQAACEQGLVPD